MKSHGLFHPKTNYQPTASCSLPFSQPRLEALMAQDTINDVSKKPTPEHDQRGVSDKLADEARLLWGAKDTVWQGIKNGVSDMLAHPGHGVGAIALGALAGAVATNPYGRIALYGLSALGIGATVAPEAYDVWKNKNNLTVAQQSLGLKVGETLAYAPLAAAGSYMGARATQLDWRGMYSRAQFAVSGEAPPPLNLTQNAADELFARNPSLVSQTQKQHYPVKFDRITQANYTEPGGMRIDSLESIAAKQPGELATEGKWLATRVTPSGATVTENGNAVKWSVKPDKILKAYDIQPSQLENANSVTAWTKVDGPKVPMIPLHNGGSIEAWGTTLSTQPRPQVSGWLANMRQIVKGEPLGWLSHYGAGDNAIVSPIQFNQTYEVVVPPIWNTIAPAVLGTTPMHAAAVR
jgi:hypothetical protein